MISYLLPPYNTILATGTSKITCRSAIYVLLYFKSHFVTGIQIKVWPPLQVETQFTHQGVTSW